METIKAGLAVVLKQRITWIVAGYAFAIWMPITAFASLWGVPFIQTAYHVSNTVATSVNSVIWVGVAIGSLLVGAWSDRIKQRKLPLITVSLLGVIVSTIIIYSHVSFIFLYPLFILFGAASGGQSLSFAVVKDHNPPHLVGTAIGFNNAAVVASGIIFQPLVGWLLTAHHHGHALERMSHYTLSDYHVALLLIPFAYLISLIVAIVFLQEDDYRISTSMSTVVH